MDLILKNITVIGKDGENITDIGVSQGTIVAIENNLSGDAETFEMQGNFAIPGFVESHIHLDKACIMDRCKSEEGTLAEAIREVSAAKEGFTVEDIRHRAIQTLEKSIVQGTTRMRTHLEVDPVIGLKSVEAVMPLISEYSWAIDLEICVFPQEGLLNNPGTDELMVEALRRGVHVVGGCPYTDTNPRGQIERIFEIANRFDVDIDFHLDFDTDPSGMTVIDVCEFTDKYSYGGRVAIGHVSKLSALQTDQLEIVANKLAASGIAVTVLPSTDLHLMGGGRDHNIVRGVAPVHRLLQHGVNCSLATNNVLNPFTPFGDCSMIRMANLYANISQIGKDSDFRSCFEMVTNRPAKLMRLEDYGLEIGNPADIVVLNCRSDLAAVQEIALPLYGFKRGRKTFTHRPPILHKP